MKLEKKSIPQLKKMADTLTSEIVRRKGADWKGENSCYTCLVKKRWQELQCGHYVSRVYTNLRWYLPNLRPQCYMCNIMKKGNMDEFALRLERETPGILKELNDWKHRPSTLLKARDLIELIKELKLEVSKLK